MNKHPSSITSRPRSESKFSDTNMKSDMLVRSTLLSALRQEGNPRLLKQIPSKEADQRKLLGDLLIASHTSWKKETLDLLDEIYRSETPLRKTISVRGIASDPHALIATHQNTPTKIAVWKGDITQLSVDAIVNAANDAGLGCFQPSHRCIDNVIHRAAGPRLRLACQEAMNRRGAPLYAGSPPIVTPAFHLPSQWVLHVTGPQIVSGAEVTAMDENKLSNAYRLSLDAAAQQGAKSIAFPCISTGLFGFPQGKASEIALATVDDWIQEHPNKFDWIVFDVFTEEDLHLYKNGLTHQFSISSSPPVEEELQQQKVTFESNVVPVSVHEKMNLIAKTWIDQADAILICAGAGMSVKQGEMVYTNANDFASHYPYFTKYGYHTAYEAMGLFGDPTVPVTAKWAFWANHLMNMRYNFKPNEGYDWLIDMINGKEHFVLTSNVDGCFPRAGFDPDRIYTPQGDYAYLQCMKPCRHDSVYDAKPILEKLIPLISEDGTIPEENIPKCPRCGGDMFGNVRGGSWFLHSQYEDHRQKLVDWMDAQNGKNVVVVEVGAGFNTPMVTRWPVESFVRETGGKLIRINPSDPEIPGDIEGLAFEKGWQVLGEIKDAPVVSTNEQLDGMIQDARQFQDTNSLLTDDFQTTKIARYMGHFNWKRFLKSLSR